MSAAVPVLLYHHIAPFSGESYTITPAGFENHLRVLRDEGFTPVPLRSVRKYLGGQGLTDERPIVITFDDGYLDNWTQAFPILERLQVPATIFVVTSWLSDEQSIRGQGTPALPRSAIRRMIRAGRERAVTFSWVEAREMVASGLIDIQSHTVSHAWCDPPKNAAEWEDIRRSLPEIKYRIEPPSLDGVRAELVLSKQKVEERIGRSCYALSWPWGIYGPETSALAIASGYDCLCTVRAGGNRTVADLLALRRVMVARDDSRWLRRRLRVFSRPNLLRLFDLYTHLRRLALRIQDPRSFLQWKYRFKLR